MASQPWSYDPNFKPGPDLCLVNRLDSDDEAFNSLPNDEKRAITCQYGNCALKAFKSSSDDFETINSCEYETDVIDPLVD